MEPNMFPIHKVGEGPEEFPMKRELPGEAGPRGHIWTKHENCWDQSCMICAGGLALCFKCGALEGSIPTECPGAKIAYDILQDIYEGRIDYRNGQWTTEFVSKSSPAWYESTEGKAYLAQIEKNYEDQEGLGDLEF